MNSNTSVQKEEQQRALYLLNCFYQFQLEADGNNNSFSDTRKSNRNPKLPPSSSVLQKSASNPNLRTVRAAESHVTKEKTTQPKYKKKSGKKSDKKLQQPHQQQQLQKQKQPSFQQLPKPTPTITSKDYVDMVMSDLSTRPALWHFSSYGLSLNSTQSLPFPFLGTTEISPEELRLQVYAEAAATGGRIDNYVKVVGDIKERAELTTKALIPNLERVIDDLLRANNVNLNPSASSASSASSNLQENLKQTLKQRIQSTTMSAPTIHSLPNMNFESLIQLPQTIPIQPPSTNNSIITDDAFSFGSIPELPPSI